MKMFRAKDLATQFDRGADLPRGKRGGRSFCAVAVLVSLTFVTLSFAAESRPLDPYETLFEKKYKFLDNIPDHQPSWVGYHCVATALAYRRAKEGAAFADVEKLRLQTIAAADFIELEVDTYGGDGWGDREPRDAFSDNTWNPPYTVYAADTGIATWCMVEAGAVLAEEDPVRANRYRNLAQHVLDVYRTTAYKNVGYIGNLDCTASTPCGYFWYSLNSNDFNRYVKNINTHMAVPLLAFHRRFTNSTFFTIGDKVTRSQHYEIRQDNYRYLGLRDPNWSSSASQQWNDHNASEVYNLLHAGELRHSQSFMCSAWKQRVAYRPNESEDVLRRRIDCAFARRNSSAWQLCQDSVDEDSLDVISALELVADLWPENTTWTAESCP